MGERKDYLWLVLVFLLFVVALLEAVFISLPITLFLVIVLAFYWEEKIFPWAFWVGVWRDLASWCHLGVWSMIFLAAALLTIIIKRRGLGLESNKLSLPK